MTSAAIDTHEVVREPGAAGSDDAQAEAVTRLLRRVEDVDIPHPLARTDLRIGMASMRSGLQAGLAEIRTGLLRGPGKAMNNLSETKADRLTWMVGTAGLQTIVSPGAVIALARMPRP